MCRENNRGPRTVPGGTPDATGAQSVWLQEMAKCSDNKGAYQLHGYSAADLRLCFRICKKQVHMTRRSFSYSFFVCIFQAYLVQFGYLNDETENRNADDRRRAIRLLPFLVLICDERTHPYHWSPFSAFGESGIFLFNFINFHFLVKFLLANSISRLQYVNVSVLIKFSQKTSVFTLIIISSP